MGFITLLIEILVVAFIIINETTEIFGYNFTYSLIALVALILVATINIYLAYKIRKERRMMLRPRY